MMSVTSLVAASIVISALGMVVFGALTGSAWLHFRRHPSATTSWQCIATLALTWAMATLMFTAVGAAMAQSGVDAATRDFMSHVAFVLRGGLLALALSLVYGWRKLPQT
jgi:hypothetical protein